MTDLEEMADALGTSPERLRQIAANLASVARSGPTMEEFACEVLEGAQRLTVLASEAFAGLGSYRS